MSSTLFDAIMTGSDTLSEARSFIAFGIRRVPEELVVRSATAFQIVNTDDLIALGDGFGETLRKHFGPQEGLEIFALFAAGVLKALQGEGLPEASDA